MEKLFREVGWEPSNFEMGCTIGSYANRKTRKGGENLPSISSAFCYQNIIVNLSEGD